MSMRGRLRLFELAGAVALGIAGGVYAFDAPLRAFWARRGAPGAPTAAPGEGATSSTPTPPPPSRPTTLG